MTDKTETNEAPERPVLVEGDVMPCPFCGETSVSVVEGSTFRCLVVECNLCGARGPEIRRQTVGNGKPSDWVANGSRYAISMWNDRHN